MKNWWWILTLAVEILALFYRVPLLLRHPTIAQLLLVGTVLIPIAYSVRQLKMPTSKRITVARRWWLVTARTVVGLMLVIVGDFPMIAGSVKSAAIASANLSGNREQAHIISTFPTEPSASYGP